MKIFVLSLKNETGKKRRKRLNYEHEIIWGTDKLEYVPSYIKDKITIPYNVKDKEKLIRQKSCHIYSYLNILKKIIDDNLYYVIICEDDAILKHHNENLFIDLQNKNLDEPVLLNGKLHHPDTYKKDNIFNKYEIKFNNGINDIDYNSFRWSCSACIYYPTPQSCKYIYNYIINTSRLTYFDLQLSKNKIIKKLYYPSIFIIDDEGVSQICNSKGTIDNYI